MPCCVICRYEGYKGKVALITGATLGIGYAIAERMGLSGAKIVICSRSQKNVDNAVNSLKKQGIEVTGFPIHVGTMQKRKELVEAAVKAYGKIDILVSNVAVNPVFGPMAETTDEKAWVSVYSTEVMLLRVIS